MNTHALVRRTIAAAAGALALPALVLALFAAVPARAQTSAATASAGKISSLTFDNQWRKLWQDHGTWTRLVIDSFTAGSPSLTAYEARLLRNQTDIGNAIKPYYGAAAGTKLTQLLRGHIIGAVVLLEAAKSGNTKALSHAQAAWYANGRQIADFLSAANPRNWPRSAVRAMMKMHLDQVIQQAVDELGSKHAASVRDYDVYIDHILVMADTISGGIIKQFPQRFAG
jgi:hypothetical protein